MRTKVLDRPDGNITHIASQNETKMKKRFVVISWHIYYHSSLSIALLGHEQKEKDQINADEFAAVQKKVANCFTNNAGQMVLF